MEQVLKNLSKDRLIKLVSAVHGIYSDIDDIIARHLEASEPTSHSDDGLYETFTRQISVLNNENEFIDWRSSSNFSYCLRSLLHDIDTLVRQNNPTQALALVEAFLNITDHTMNRSDDSSCEIGGVFSEAMDLWLDIAAEVRAGYPEYEKDWVAEVLHYFDTNDYGCWDNCLSHSTGLLNDDELTKLAWRFENQIKDALGSTKPDSSNTFNYNRAASHASFGLRSVAEALKDLALFEKATLLQSPEPNELQMSPIVEFALTIENYPRAQFWLDQPRWTAERGLHKKLTTQLLRQQGDIAQIKENFRIEFSNHPNHSNLEDYWEMATEDERKTLQLTVTTIAPNAPDIRDAINMLLFVDEIQLAAQTVVTRASEIATVFYGTLTTWIRNFEEHQQTLASILCYRALLNDILDGGRSQAYHHGADYFHALRKLDKIQTDYQTFETAQEYIARLQNKHGRKRSFWQQAGYPSKANS